MVRPAPGAAAEPRPGPLASRALRALVLGNPAGRCARELGPVQLAVASAGVSGSTRFLDDPRFASNSERVRNREAVVVGGFRVMVRL